MFKTKIRCFCCEKKGRNRDEDEDKCGIVIDKAYTANVCE